MARQGRLNSDLGRLPVTDLTDHQNVGILTQKGPQGGRKGVADGRLNVRLIDAGERVLDWVFDGEDLSIQRIEFLQRGIEGRGLATSGRAGAKQNTVRTR